MNTTDSSRSSAGPNPFELQPTLSGKLISLFPLKSSDFEKLYATASDPLVWEQHPLNDRYKRDVFEGFFECAIESGGAFLIVDNETKEVMGSSRYYDLVPSEDRVTIGYTFLARKYWGGTYNRELKSLMLDHAFRFVSNAVFEIGEHNLRSRKAIEKIGGEFVEYRKLETRTQAIYRIRRMRSQPAG